jgi:hypothetical protein
MNTPLTDEQRRGFAELVKEAQKKFEQDFESAYGFSRTRVFHLGR